MADVVRISQVVDGELDRVSKEIRIPKKQLVEKAVLKLVANFDFIDEESGGFAKLSESMKEEVRENLFNPAWLKEEYF